MNILSRITLITVSLAVMYTSATTHAFERPWSDWYQVEDQALNGIWFSWKCDKGTCAWRWDNRYTSEVKIRYTLRHVDTSGKVTTVVGDQRLTSGENESNNFRLPTNELKDVKVTLLEPKYNGPQSVKYVPGSTTEVDQAKKRRQDETAAQQREENARAEEARERERQERQAKQERREAERAEQARQDREDTRQIWMNGLQGIQQSIYQAQQTYNNSVQQGIEIRENQRRERERQAREAEESARRQRQAEADQRRQADRDRAEESRRQREQEQERVRVAQAETERQERARRQQAEEQERRRAEQAERERKKAEDEAKWQVEDFTATRWGCDELYRKSNGVVATLTNSKGEVVLGESRYVRIFNPDNKYSIQYTVANSSYRDRTLGPGREVIVPLNLPANVKEVNEAVVRVRYHAGE